MYDEHDISRNVRSISTFARLEEILNSFPQHLICKGIINADLIEVFRMMQTPLIGIFCHATQSVKSINCKGITSGAKCIDCLKYENCLKTTQRKIAKRKGNTHKKCNNRYMTNANIAAKARKYKTKKIILKQKLGQMKNKLASVVKKCDPITDHDNQDLMVLLTAAKKNIDTNTSLELFLRAQLQAAKRKSRCGFK